MNVKHFLSVLCLLSAVCLMAQETPAIVPLPNSINMLGNMNHEYGNEQIFETPKSGVFDGVVNTVKPYLKRLSNGTMQGTTTHIKMVQDTSAPAEGYTLRILPQEIVISASDPAGAFYAMQTLMQLLAQNQGKVPAMVITDAPRFGWRGFMLDEGRHIFGKDEVKRVIDMMAAHKMNRFHWHLTEDQGWRLEIKKYPKLTDVGAWRNSRALGYGDAACDTIYYGGYYTQDDVREIVDYAKERFIEIIPEIDIPGHTQAAVAAYPEILACDPENPHEVWLSQGVSADVMNVANPEAVQMTKDIIDEVIKLFPYSYLHLGGDECPTDKWEKNEQCQAKLKEIGSDNYRDLQLNYYRELSDHIAAKAPEDQRKLIFWNEVLHGNTDLIGNDITIMAWIGADKAALDAASRGMTTILSPQIPYYINRKQSDSPKEPMSQGRGTETVKRVYEYVPMSEVPDSLQDKYMGVQAHFWSEWVETPEVLEYLMMPRLAAVAEAGWTQQELRDYPDFRRRVIELMPAVYNRNGWNYAKHILNEKPDAEQ